QVTDPRRQGTANTRPYLALPEAQLLPGEIQRLFVTANPTTGGGGRSAIVYFRTAVDRSVTLPAAFIAPRFSAVGDGPELRPRARFVTQPDYDRYAGILYQQNGTLFSVAMTGTYAALVGGFDLVIPDLSAAAGYSPTWALRPREELVWSSNRIGGTA